MRTYEEIMQDSNTVEKPTGCVACGEEFADNDIVCEAEGSDRHARCCPACLSNGFFKK